MGLAKDRKEFYLQRRIDNDNGISSGIPWGLIFPKIGSIVPIIPKGYQILWTAGSGIGKSQTWIGIIMYSIYKIKKDYPQLNLKTKIVIALLEDTKEMFVDRLYSMIIYDKYKEKVPGFKLQSMGTTLDKKKYIQYYHNIHISSRRLLISCRILQRLILSYYFPSTFKYISHSTLSSTILNGASIKLLCQIL